MPFKGFKRNVSFLWVEGIAIFPFVFVKKGRVTEVLLNHERIHLRQQLEMGILPFYIWYLCEYLFRLLQYRRHHIAYLNISFEKEAYLHQQNPDYLLSRRWWAFVRYL